MRPVAALAAELTADRRTDGALLAAFVSDHDEPAFAELLRRHGPLVWGACRRALPNRADAEDAFQATFLVLVRRGSKLTRAAALGPWLHRVAVWTARNVRRKNARRLARQRDLSACTEPAAPVPPAPRDADLDSALLALPDRVREAIVLCHLQGYSRREAAERLGCAEGTLSAWLSRGLAKLRRELLDPAALAVPTLVVPAALSAATAKAATATSLAPAVSFLVEGVLHMLWIKKATAAACSAIVLFALGVGIGLSTNSERGTATAQERAQEGAKQPEAKVSDAALKRVEELRKELAAAEAVAELSRMQLVFAHKHEKAAREKNKGESREVRDATKTAEVSGRNFAVAAMKVESLQAEIAALGALGNSYLEVTVRGTAGKFEFVVYEVLPHDPAKRGEIPRLGPVVTSDRDALALLLRRARADLNAPLEVRVIAEPQVTLGVGPRWALEACSKAGHPTVKFTGYVFGGGFAQELKPDEKGDVRGYTRYEAKPVKPAHLANEIGEGMRRF